MKKLQLLSLAALFLFGACSKDDEFKGFTEIGVDVTSPGDEVVSDVKILVYDALNENAYVKTIEGSSLSLTDLEASTYNLVALGNAEGLLEATEDYSNVKLLQHAMGEKNLYVAMQKDYVFPAELEELSLDLQQVSGVLKIKSTDLETADYDSLSVTVVVPKGKYAVVDKAYSGDPVTITKGFNTNGGLGFDEEFMVFPGTVAVNMEYFKNKNSIHTLDLGTAEVVAGETIAIEKPFNEGVNRFIEIPDETLRDILKRELPDAFDANDIFDTKHASVVALTSFSAVYKNIKDFTGVQYMTGLTDLSISYNFDAEGTLDLSGMKNLVTCDVSYCAFDAIIVDGLDKMETFNCGGNQLTSLDVSSFTALTYLEFGGNADLKDITLGSLPNVTTVVGYDCALEGELDFTGYSALDFVILDRNKLSSVNFQGITTLTDVQCADNDITTLNLSGCTGITNIACGGNQLSTLDVSELTNLVDLGCGENFITSLDLSANNLLVNLQCYNNTLSSINLAGCTALKNIYANNNKFETIDVSECSALGSLNLNDNLLTSLDVSNNTNIATLECNNNKLTTLNVSGLANLGTLKCSDNELAELNITDCSTLMTLECAGSNQTLTDITGLVVNDYLWKIEMPLSAICGTNIVAWFEGMTSAGNYMSVFYQDAAGELQEYTADTCQ